jgi:CBS domain containing-hemolysin-like protein
VRPPISDSVPLLIALVAVMLLAVFLAGAEASLLRVSRVRALVLAEEGDRRAARVVRLLADLPAVVNTVLLVVLLAQIAAATIAGIVAERHFGNAGVTVASIALTLVMFVYAEAIPKTVAVRNPILVARLVAAPVAVLTAALRPLVGLLVAFADLQAPGKGIAAPPGVTEAELRRLAAEAAESGHIADTDLELIERAFAAGDEQVAAVMVPRPAVVSLRAGTPTRTALDVAITHGHRRIPVVAGDLDDVVGVVRLRDLAQAVADGLDVSLEDLARPVLVVPETRRVIDVLRDMQGARRTLAVVVDEHGGTAGIVTVEDVVEELVGSIAEPDRGADVRPRIRAVGAGRWIVDGGADVDDLAAELGVDLPAGDWHTAAGLVLALAGRIPRTGDTVRAAGYTFRVAAATKRRVVRISVERDR